MNTEVRQPGPPEAAAKKRKAAKKPAPVPVVPKPELAKAPEPQPAEPDGHEVRVLLQGRHFEWLETAARREGRTPAGFAERLIRLAYAADPNKGKDGGSGATLPGKFGAGVGVTGSHPARGGE